MSLYSEIQGNLFRQNTGQKLISLVQYSIGLIVTKKAVLKGSSSYFEVELGDSMSKNRYKTDYVVLKHDELRELTKTLTSIDEQRLMNSCLTLVHQGKLLDSECKYDIDVNNYAIKGGITTAKAYAELKTMLEYYFKAAIDIPKEGTSILRTHIISDYTYDDVDLTLTVKFHKEVIPLLSGDMPKGMYCYYDTRLDNVPSNRRYLMGELLQRNFWKFHKHKGQFSLKLSEIRSAINLTSEEYKVVDDLVRRVIVPTLKDIADILGIYINYTRSKGNFTFIQVNKEDFGKRAKEQRVEPNGLHKDKTTVKSGMVFSSLRQLFNTLQILILDESYTKDRLEQYVSLHYNWDYLTGRTGKVIVFGLI